MTRKFYNLIDQSLNKRRSQRNVLIGDLDSQVGTKDYVDEDALGTYDYG